MSNVHNKPEQIKSRRRVTICESPVNPPDSKEPCLFATEPKFKSRDVKMYHVYRVTETTGLTKTMAIIDIANICRDISSLMRYVTDGIV